MTIEEELTTDNNEETPNEEINVLFEKEINISTDTKHESQILDKTISKSVEEDLTTTVVPEVSELISIMKYTSHPICMKVENSKIKMVDLTSTLIKHRDLPMAPDGFIPNSEIRLILKRPFQDCLPLKPIPVCPSKDDTKKLFDEILLKYLPEDLVAEPQNQLQFVQDIAILAESKNARNKGVVTLEDNDELNKDLVDQIEGEDDMDGMMQNISMRTAKSKRKKYARQITKATMMNQLEKKVKEKEEMRREQIQRDEEKLQIEKEEENRKNLMEASSVNEVVDIDILDTLDQNLKDDKSREKLIAKRKEKDKKKLEEAFGKINTNDLINMLFQAFGKDETHKLLYGAIKNDNDCINKIDSIIKTRQNRLLVLNAIIATPYVFDYLAYNLGGDHLLINVAIMMDDASLIDKSTLSDTQATVTDILGNETNMVQYLSKLNGTLISAFEKLKSVVDESPYDILLAAFQNKEKAIETLNECLGSKKKKDLFLNHIKNCEDHEIEKFPLPERSKRISSTIKKEKKTSLFKTEVEKDLYGNMSEEQKRLLPSLPGAMGLTETPIEFAARIAKTLQSKTKTDTDMSDITDKESPISSLMESKSKKSKHKSINEEMIFEAQKALRKSQNAIAKKKPKYHENIVKSELQDIKIVDEDYELSKSLKVVGQQKNFEEMGKKTLSSQVQISMAEMLKNYFERLLKQDWWPPSMNIIQDPDSILLALVKIAYNSAKISDHTEICHSISEFKKMFSITQDTQEEAVNTLYNYFKEHRESAIKAKSEDNISSHMFYCKRVLNVLDALKGLDEDIEEFKEDFMNKHGQMEVPRQVSVHSKKGKELIKEASASLKLKLPDEKLDSLPSAKDKVKHLLDTLKTSQDPEERKSVITTLQTLFNSNTIPEKVKLSIIQDTNTYFQDLTKQLQQSLNQSKDDDNNLKIYKELLQTSDIINNIAKDVAGTQSSEIEVLKIPNLEELKLNPKLLAQAKRDSDRLAKTSVKLEKINRVEEIKEQVDAFKVEHVIKGKRLSDKMKPRRSLKKVDKHDENLKQDDILRSDKGPTKLSDALSFGSEDARAFLKSESGKSIDLSEALFVIDKSGTLQLDDTSQTKKELLDIKEDKILKLPDGTTKIVQTLSDGTTDKKPKVTDYGVDKKPKMTDHDANKKQKLPDDVMDKSQKLPDDTIDKRQKLMDKKMKQNAAKMSEKEYADVQHIDKQLAGEQHIDKQLTDKQQIDKQLADKQHIDKQLADKQHIDKQLAEKQHSDKQLTDEQHVDNQSVDKPQTKDNAIDKDIMERQISDKESIDKQLIDKEIIKKTLMDEQKFDKQFPDEQQTQIQESDKSEICKTRIDKPQIDNLEIYKQHVEKQQADEQGVAKILSGEEHMAEQLVGLNQIDIVIVSQDKDSNEVSQDMIEGSSKIKDEIKTEFVDGKILFPPTDSKDKQVKEKIIATVDKGSSVDKETYVDKKSTEKVKQLQESVLTDKEKLNVLKPSSGISILDQVKAKKAAKEKIEYKIDKDVVSSFPSSPQNVIRDLFTSLESNLSPEKIDSTDPQLISKILVEQIIASQIDPSQLENISREMIQNLIQKVPIMDTSKQALEEILINNIEKLVLKFSDTNETPFETKSELLVKIQDVSSILKTLAKETDKRDESMKHIQFADEDHTVQIPLEINLMPPEDFTNQTDFLLQLKRSQEEEVDKKRIRHSMIQHLHKNLIKSNADLSTPTNLIEDLIKQKDQSTKDPDKSIQISKALYEISQDPMVNNNELMEMIASHSFSNLITDMQNVLSQSLKQYDIPPTLKLSLSNFLLLKHLGIQQLDDFEDELRAFHEKYPDDVNFETNPLSQSLYSMGPHNLNMSKFDVIIDNKLNFLRSVSSLRPVDKKTGFEMGLLIKHSESEDEERNLLTLLYSDDQIDSTPFPIMFNIPKEESKKMIEDYHKKEELRQNITDIENIVKVHERDIDKKYKIDSMNSIIDVAREVKPGSKSKLINMINKSPALKALAGMGPIVDVSMLPSALIKSKKEAMANLPKITYPSSPGLLDHRDFKGGQNLYDTNKDLPNETKSIVHEDHYKTKKSVPGKQNRKTFKVDKAEKRIKYKSSTEMKVHAKIERKLTNYGQPNMEELVAKKASYYGSIDALRVRIKEEISREYSNFVKKVDVESILNRSSEASTIPDQVLSQTRNFQRFYGKNATLLPFIGKSKSLVGNVLDQGLRALHFNLGPGTLVKAILENQRGFDSDMKTSQDEWWTDGSKLIDNVLENDHDNHTEPKKYLSSKHMMHCRMTSRPSSIPVHEWSKVAILGTRRNLRPGLFSAYHQNSHCAYQVLANKHLHRHGISISKHLERYETLEIVNKSLQENAYVRIQNSLLKCLMRVLEDN